MSAKTNHTIFSKNFEDEIANLDVYRVYLGPEIRN